MKREPPTLPVPSAFRTALAAGEKMVQHQDEIVQLLEWLASPLNIVIELGMHMGATTRLFASLARETVIAVDLPDGQWGGISPESAIVRNADLCLAYPHVTAILGDSHDWQTRAAVSSTLGWRQADLLFIDGDHSLVGVEQDYQMYSPFVRPGGVIAFHDIVDSAFHRSIGVGVRQFWDSLAADVKVEFCCGSDWGGIGAIRC